ncbi:MAG: beta-N-acetylglucosaminidase domain-containing protein [Terriglobia bacterium]
MLRLTRRQLLRWITASAGLAFAGSSGAASTGSAQTPSPQPFRVALPRQLLPLPEGASNRPAFTLRGIKGWAWTPPQYLETIPVMAKCKMNFLMNCYSSMWDLEVHGKWARIPNRTVNHWDQPLPKAKKAAYERVVASCRQRGIEFCFSMNPILSSTRPFDYGKPSDFEALWKHYAWMQDSGVRWFNISLDDIRQGIDAGAQARTVNEIFSRLRARDPRARMIFTPTWYAGTGQSGKESHARLGSGDTPGHRYTREIAETLDPEVYLYWTGPEVCSLTITRADAEAYKALAKHRLFIWDNYPCNDARPTLHLGPLMGRDPELAAMADGYISNPLSPQDEANWIPMLTIADYLWSPEGYEPDRSIGQAIAHLEPDQPRRLALRDLVELYPGRLVDRSQSTGWNSLREQFLASLDNRKNARQLIAQAQDTSQRMSKLLPDRYALAHVTLNNDIEAMRRKYSQRFS